MSNVVLQLGRTGIQVVERLGRSGVFLCATVFRIPKWRELWPLLSTQLYRVGVLSLVIILISAMFIGMVVSLQGFNTLQKFGAEQELGQLIALSVVRELGPVITALLFAGRADSALTAEIGLMRATRQISSLDMMAVDPLWYVVSPRLWAGFIALPILTVLFNITAIYGGFLVGVKWLGVNDGLFWSNMHSAVSFQADILNGVIKSIVFGFVVTWVAVYQGFYSQPTAAGISRSTTRTVVYGSVMVMALDFVLTAVMMGGW